MLTLQFSILSIHTDHHVLTEQDGLSPHEFYQMKIEDINEIVGSVRKHLTKARQIQVNNHRLFAFHYFYFLFIIYSLCAGHAAKL